MLALLAATRSASSHCSVLPVCLFLVSFRHRLPGLHPRPLVSGLRSCGQEAGVWLEPGTHPQADGASEQHLRSAATTQVHAIQPGLEHNITQLRHRDPEPDRGPDYSMQGEGNRYFSFVKMHLHFLIFCKWDLCALCGGDLCNVWCAVAFPKLTNQQHRSHLSCVLSHGVLVCSYDSLLGGLGV